MKRINVLEEENVAYKTGINKSKSERLSLEDNLKIAQDNRGNFKNRAVLQNENITIINREHNDLLVKLKELHSNWYHYDSIYKRERTIIPHLTSKIDILHQEKEKLLMDERITGRYKDDYEKQNIFTVEPAIEKWVINWKTQFTVIETGTQYIQRASKELKQSLNDFLKHYPYWSLAIIVKEEEIQKLEEKIASKIDKIRYPILILSQQQAMNIVKNGNAPREKLIFPKHWSKNIVQENFEKWKTEINEKAYQLTDNRIEKEKEIQKHTQLLKEVTYFLNIYPYDDLRKLEVDLEETKEKIKSLEIQINQTEENLLEIQQNSDRYHQGISDNKDEIYQLQQWIQSAGLYIRKEKEFNHLISFTKEAEEEINKHRKNINTIQREFSIIEDRIEELQEEKWIFNNKLNTLQQDVLYNDVIDVQPKYTTTSKAGLQEERNYLKELFNKQQGNLYYLETLIKKDKKRKQDLNNELERERLESSYPIDETIDYNLYGDGYLNQLLKSINHLKIEKKRKERNFNKKQRQYDQQSTIISVQEQQFFNEFDEKIIFEDPLDIVKINITEEKADHQERSEKNKKTYERLLKKEKEINEGIRSLDIEDAKHSYLLEGVKIFQLEQEFYSQFPYHRIAFIESLKKDLENLDKKRQDSYQKLEEHKNRFINFYDEQIKEPRLRERTVTGVKQKNKYEEIIQWQTRMEKSIRQTIRVAEDDMREHDKDLEQFVNYLYTYLRTITEELSMIPKKTRIKVEDKWKEIYVFNIPNWEEEEGKVEIRKYIDWILQELENTQYKNEDGSENNISIRKEIEKWLDIKQLLPIVLQNNPIKISCRKVTNDNKISSSLTTWESSNKWSGGEKWSKNMTLFLGILNYLAEKRQGMKEGLKINSTVIVDNPFGKASSDHVLDPVFYIAEKLGFQIIALTAHTEGSFIRNYFPVVYSCRLREAVNNKSMIIDKEREIQYVFFRDKDPNSLDRLQQKEQLSLFDR